MVKSESEVAQCCPIFRDPMDCSLPGSSVHGIFQARVLEWAAIAFSTISLEVRQVGTRKHNWKYLIKNQHQKNKTKKTNIMQSTIF